ncbi:hypothetical protein J2Z21_003681 [Streptomyces griseochromogenes]|uniref:Uncharacterized protein n=1 Tax=Streptomyces griseochromogenes TaxID=68214 RepID=A0A1B1AP25_9ACTN|nr:hypothetical protein [Streptomyces griseochromogenes]ANP48327.1 hypothetical protein AVL59_00930 [Streptomyces griseochromogenes]MBP2050731.1 hypothetical protein [Streptomyces griseochromogenes]
MASDAALEHAQAILDRFTRGDEDPRRTRIDLLQVAHCLARASRQDAELRELLGYVREWSGRQAVSADDLDEACKGGYPIVQAMPGPIGWAYATARLIGHGALRAEGMSERLEQAVQDSSGLSERVRGALERSESDLFSALVALAGQRADESDLFRSRIIAAAKDAHRLFSDDELPRPIEFRRPRPATPDWPPLRLGITPIGGSRFDEDPDGDWGDGGGGGGSISCSINSGQSAGENAACVAVIVVVVIVILASK